MKIAILDGDSLFPGDISLKPLTDLGDFTIYPSTKPETICAQIGASEGIFVNKSLVTRHVMEMCPNLKFISVTATGYNNIDIEAAKERKIAVCNVPAYSTDAVAQHTFALILALSNHAEEYNASVRNGDWTASGEFCYMLKPLSLLAGKSLGIIGYGNIGKKVSEIGKAFGMKINIYSRDPKATISSDIITLHCPVTAENQGFINESFINQLKDGAIIINTARGALIDDQALANGLKSGKLSAAAIDVLATEPPQMDNPLFSAPNCLITPHISWIPKETRQHLINKSSENLKSFLEGGFLNRIV